MKLPKAIAAALLLSSIPILGSALQVHAEDGCRDFSGQYQLVTGSEEVSHCRDGRLNGTDCFRFPSTRFEIRQDGCNSVTLHVRGLMIGKDTPMQFGEDGDSLIGAQRALLRNVSTTLRVSQEDPNILEMEYGMKNALPGGLGQDYVYRAEFRKVD